MTIGIGAVILAAGEGSRLGGVAKALLSYGHHTFLDQIVETARAVGLVDAVVVVGEPFGDQVAAHVRALGLRVRVNVQPQRGMASSVALGFAALASGPAAAGWLWPVDHPAIREDSLRRLIAAMADPEVEVAQPRYRGQGGHPPLIARALWPRLAACGDAPGGARDVLRAARAIAVDVDDAAVVRDVDTEADRQALAEGS